MHVDVLHGALRLHLFNNRLDKLLAHDMTDLSVLLLESAHLLTLLRVRSLHAWRLAREQVLDRQYLVEQLELLLRHLLVTIYDRQSVELSNVLEAIHDEAFERTSIQHFIVVDKQLLERLNALDLAEQNERIQVVVRQNKLLQLGELSQLIKIRVVNDEIEAHVSQVHLLHDVVEFGAGEHFKSVSVNVEDTVALDLGVTALHETLVAEVRLVLRVLCVDTVLLDIEALHFTFPLFLDDLDNGILLCLLLGGRVARLAKLCEALRRKKRRRLLFVLLLGILRLLFQSYIICERYLCCDLGILQGLDGHELLVLGQLRELLLNDVR